MTFDVGEAIHSARTYAFASIREVARASGVADTTIVRIERRELDPSIDVTLRILASLGLTLQVVALPDDADAQSRPAERAGRQINRRPRPSANDVQRVLDEYGCTDPRVVDEGGLVGAPDHGSAGLAGAPLVRGFGGTDPARLFRPRDRRRPGRPGPR